MACFSAKQSDVSMWCRGSSVCRSCTIHRVFVSDRKAFEEDEPGEEEEVDSGGGGGGGAEDVCGRMDDEEEDSWVDVAFGELMAGDVADVGKERLIIEFPRGYGCVLNFIFAVQVVVPLWDADAVAVAVAEPNDSCGGGICGGGFVVAPSVVGVDQPQASVSTAVWWVATGEKDER